VKPHAALLLPLCATLLSCGPDEPAAPTSLVPSGYATTFVEVRGCRMTSEHTATTPGLVVSHIRVLTNPEAAAPYRANAARLPVGSLVVKEEYADPSCSRLRAWTVMRKEPAGYDPPHNDWRWQRVRAVDQAVLVDGRVSSCISCHDTPACTARDWQCTVP
jgi:hypothetical protein